MYVRVKVEVLPIGMQDAYNTRYGADIPVIFGQRKQRVLRRFEQ
jgi:hypothetical protein